MHSGACVNLIELKFQKLFKFVRFVSITKNLKKKRHSGACSSSIEFKLKI